MIWEWFCYIVIGLYGLLVVWMSFRPSRKPAGVASIAKHEISIVISCKNEAEHLRRLLPQLEHLRAELIVVDDHSEDETVAVAEKHGAQVITNEGKGKKSAIKSGVRRAANKIILTLDADIIIDRKWLTRAIDAIDRTEADCFMFPVLASLEGTFRPKYGAGDLLALFDALDMLGLANTSRAFASAGHPIMANGAALAFSRELYLEAEAHLRMDIESGDDTFLVQYAALHKKKVAYFMDRDLHAEVHPNRNVWKFFKQRIRWGQKTTAYPSGIAHMVAWLIFLVNLLTLILFAEFMLEIEEFPLMLLLVKGTLDLLFLISGSIRFRRHSLLLWWALLGLYPLYIVITAIAGFFYHPKWRS